MFGLDYRGILLRENQTLFDPSRSASHFSDGNFETHSYNQRVSYPSSGREYAGLRQSARISTGNSPRHGRPK